MEVEKVMINGKGYYRFRDCENMNTLTDFIQEELKPTLINFIDRAFPTMEFKRKGYRWSSPYHLDGTPSKTGAKERCYINPNGRFPYRVGATDNDGSLDIVIK